MKGEEFLTSGELAAELRKTERFVRRLVAERKIEHVKVGRSVRFTRRAVDDYKARNTIAAMSRAELRASLLAGVL